MVVEMAFDVVVVILVIAFVVVVNIAVVFFVNVTVIFLTHYFLVFFRGVSLKKSNVMPFLWFGLTFLL